MKVQLKDSTSKNEKILCSVCESWLPKSSFSNGSPICKTCTDYCFQFNSWKDSSHSTVISGYINLFIAVRDLAIKDDLLDDFNSFWIDQFNDIWSSLESTFDSESEYKISIY
jgi:hypothetical protein